MAMIVIMANGNIEHILNTIRPDENKKKNRNFCYPIFFLHFAHYARVRLGTTPHCD